MDLYNQHVLFDSLAAAYAHPVYGVVQASSRPSHPSESIIRVNHPGHPSESIIPVDYHAHPIYGVVQAPRRPSESSIRVTHQRQSSESPFGPYPSGSIIRTTRPCHSSETIIRVIHLSHSSESPVWVTHPSHPSASIIRSIVRVTHPSHSSALSIRVAPSGHSSGSTLRRAGRRPSGPPVRIARRSSVRVAGLSLPSGPARRSVSA